MHVTNKNNVIHTLVHSGLLQRHADVEGLGQFMELEVVLRPGQTDVEGQGIAEGLMNDLGVDPADLLEAAYMDLMERGNAS